MRIASLLPAATEICCALGLGDQLVGVSHECDYPPHVAELPRLTRTRLAPGLDSAAADAAVRRHAAEGLSLYEVDEGQLRAVRPDLVITQDTCSACAVDLAEVRRGLGRVTGISTELLSLTPSTLTEVWASFVEVGEASERSAVAAAVVEGLRDRLERVAAEAAGHRRVRTLFLEWLDPPMPPGHWTPELLRFIGADPVVSYEGGPTRATPWPELERSRPEVVLLAPCGYSIGQTYAELERAPPRLAALLASTPHAVLDGNAYFNRPGPRLVEGVEIAARIVHDNLGDAF
ncbi:MAG: cobalamin-binding protein [Myxococcota bacterium]